MKRVLYLGTDPKEFELNLKTADCEITHYPVIQIVPRDVNAQEIQQAYADLDKYTHIIFTSKNAVRVFFDHLEQLVRKFPEPQVVAVGSVTASYLVKRGVANLSIAKEETQEGIISLLKTLDLQNAYLFIPKSSLSRPALFEFLTQAQIAHHACSVYDTLTQVPEPKPDWESYDRVIFTSPSTVRAFISIFGCLPAPQRCLAIGPITQRAMDESSFHDFQM